VPQEFNFNSFEKVEDILVTQAGYYGVPARIARKRAEQYMEQLGLLDKRYTVARMLSGGMKRRLMIARALVHEPRVLVLDEPTAGVDIELRRSMWQFLKDKNAQGTTIILTTHYLEEAEALCKRVAIIDKGNLVADMNTRDLLKRLQIETFVLDLAQALPAGFDLPGYETKVIDSTTIEVTLDKQKQQTANELFVALSARHVMVQSLRNKANRLEELFVRILAGKEESTV
jgi:ABC-2 type transport system ATP-binding protein